MIRLALATAFLAICSPLNAQQTEEPNGMPCTKDSAFDTFIAELKYSVRRKDVSRLFAVTENDVQNRFPFEPGKSEFMLGWYLRENPKKSFLWPTLRTILKRPCSQIDDIRFMDDGVEGGYYMFAEKVDGRWMITGLSGDPD